MKKVQLILNIIFGLGIIALLVVYLMPEQTTDKTEKKDEVLTSSGNVDGQIAYVNIDTLLSEYDLFYEMREKLGQKQQSSQTELDSRAKQLEKSVQDFQYKVQRGLITRADAQKRQQELMQEEQELLRLREELTYSLAEEEQVLNRQLINEIREFLKVFNADGKYKYILSNSFTSNILFAKNSLNITDEVLHGLNTKYKADRDLTE